MLGPQLRQRCYFTRQYSLNIPIPPRSFGLTYLNSKLPASLTVFKNQHHRPPPTINRKLGTPLSTENMGSISRLPTEMKALRCVHSSKGFIAMFWVLSWDVNIQTDLLLHPPTSR